MDRRGKLSTQNSEVTEMRPEMTQHAVGSLCGPGKALPNNHKEAPLQTQMCNVQSQGRQRAELVIQPTCMCLQGPYSQIPSRPHLHARNDPSQVRILFFSFKNYFNLEAYFLLEKTKRQLHFPFTIMPCISGHKG